MSKEVYYINERAEQELKEINKMRNILKGNLLVLKDYVNSDINKENERVEKIDHFEIDRLHFLKEVESSINILLENSNYLINNEATCHAAYYVKAYFLYHYLEFSNVKMNYIEGTVCLLNLPNIITTTVTHPENHYATYNLILKETRRLGNKFNVLNHLSNFFTDYENWYKP